MLFFPAFFALIGGLALQWLLGYEFSVAVAVGYIALFGIAVETAVVMVVYLRDALEQRLAANRSLAPGIGSDVMKPIAAPIVGGMISSTLSVMVLVPILFTMIKEHALRRGTLSGDSAADD